jgi:uncharacterized protein (DUF58 family)
MPDGIPKPPLIQPVPLSVPPVIPPPARIQPILARLATPVAIPVARVIAPPPLGYSLLTLSELERFKNLLVFARSTVEGYFTGKHRSPYRGSSVEFADYKEYVPGDELNRIDWRAYGRTRRLFVRQYEAETDMVIYLLVDASASMSYAGARRQSKYVLAAKVAAALSYLMIHQGDKAALGLFGETLDQFHPPGGTRRHLHNLITSLERVKPAAGTGFAQALHEAGPLFKKRGRLVILSDFWTDPGELFDSLGQFLHRRFEILLLHVMDPDELNLPAANTARFRDMETHEEIEVEPEEIRRAYRQTVDERIKLVAREANHRRISHSLVNTEHPYIDAIEAYLGFRGRNSIQTG